MKKLITKNQNEKWFTFEKKNKVKFLTFLASSGCTWKDGSKIHPLIHFARPPMSVKDNRLSFVSFVVASAVLKKDDSRLIKFEDLGE